MFWLDVFDKNFHSYYYNKICYIYVDVPSTMYMCDTYKYICKHTYSTFIINIALNIAAEDYTIFINLYFLNKNYHLNKNLSLVRWSSG